MTISQGGKHKEYFMYIYETFVKAGIKCGKITERIRKPDSRTGNVYTAYQFHTSATDPYWTKLRQIFYIDGVKFVPNCIGEYLTAMDQAFWIMDDGYRRNNGQAISTHGFTQEEVQMQIRILNELFSLSAYISLVDQNRSIRGGNWIIVIPSSDMPHLRNILLPYFHSSMLYKLGYLQGDPILYQHQFQLIAMMDTLPQNVTNDKMKHNFKEFKGQYSIRYGKTPPSDTFLEWLIGFTEGDGSFIVNNRGDCAFIQIQGENNKDLLLFIANTLGFGRVIKQGPTVWRFVVEARDDQAIQIHQFNGNIIQDYRKIQFKRFLAAFNVKQLKNHLPVIEYLSNQVLISLETCWLLGFTEAEGCFTISFLKNSNAFRTRFQLSQKGDTVLPVFTRLAQQFGVGVIQGHSVKGVYEYVVYGYKNVIIIYNYFDKNIENFVGIKRLSYIKFKALNIRIANKEHQNPKLREIMVKEAFDINPFYVKKS